MSSLTAAVQEPTKSTTDRITGFPEPFSPDRNTTLPHPAADTSPNATIIAPQISGHPGHGRSRSFLSRKHSHRSTRGHKPGKSVEIENGTVTVLPLPDNGEKGLYEGIVYADGSNEGSTGNESRESSKGESEGEEGAKISEDEDRDEQGYRPGERKKGVLRKLRLHKV